MSAAFPETSEQWRDLSLFLLGSYWGYVLRPWLWVVYPPPSWTAVMVATASQESAFDVGAQGDSGTSIGIAQFNDVNLGLMTSEGFDWRLDPYTSGHAAAKYVSEGLLTSPVYWLGILPLLKYPLTRRMWTSGTSAEFSAIGDAIALVLTEHESRGLATWATWSALLWGPLVALGYYLGRNRKPGKARRGRR